ncbi:MAG: transglycosylase SLT domain-containing protein [Rhodocyclaceae bacterium]|jgi:soluble lytic murein transglycosylase|nr:transglycosylase SLT domain-containing protein [Rhodocyclaceae bacterium]
MMRKLWAAALAASLVVGMSPVRGQSGDERILAAREALRTGERSRLEALAAFAEDHPLEPYVQYWLLTNKLARPERPPEVEILAFLNAQAGSLLAERLRGEWLKRLARDGDWATYSNIFPGLIDPDRELTCLAWNARLRAGDGQLPEEVVAVLRDQPESPEACDPVLQALAADGRLDTEDLWWRFRHQMEGRRPAAAKGTLALLPAGQAPDLAELERMLKSPALYLDRLPANFSVSRSGRELAIAALVRVAREDVRAAAARFARLDERFSGEEKGYVYAVLGWAGARDHLPEALGWFRAAGDQRLAAEPRAWRVRAALRAGDWKQVRRAVEALPPPERELPEWSYWLARAEAALGNKEAARKDFERIAGQPSFYGILATEELGRSFALPPAASASSQEELARVHNDPAVQRVFALLRLDMRTEAVREWNWMLRGRDDRFLLAAARLAEGQGIHDRAISAADRTRQEHDYSLRYLAPYRERIEPNARTRGLDLGWVYGLMRQESRFVPAARSGVGAQGLMQIMPATGKWIAGKLGMKGYNVGWLQDPDTNVMFGTTYMRMVLEGLDDHPVLASAAYNAGPGRAKRWKDERPLEGAIYAETIPFSETRDYVKKVMANAVIYGALFEGRAPSLKGRLGTIAARNGDLGSGGAAPGEGLE